MLDDAVQSIHDLHIPLKVVHDHPGIFPTLLHCEPCKQRHRFCNSAHQSQSLDFTGIGAASCTTTSRDCGHPARIHELCRRLLFSREMWITQHALEQWAVNLLQSLIVIAPVVDDGEVDAARMAICIGFPKKQEQVGSGSKFVLIRVDMIVLCLHQNSTSSDYTRVFEIGRIPRRGLVLLVLLNGLRAVFNLGINVIILRVFIEFRSFWDLSRCLGL
ncbi:hypothetical protein C8J57DRAFT_1270582 [Mycena rebaudengoi]|nr:hypothetical protein C8J57DRAFT_1270582 [Mycena rebaudengoi]